MGWGSTLLTLALLGLGCFMILLVLLQRGRGGGLVGALGGPGGQSAFGTRAGDVFTKITIVVATLWVVTAGIAGMVLRRDAVSPADSLMEDKIEIPGIPDDATPADVLDDAAMAPIDSAAPASADGDAAPAGIDDGAAETPAAEVEEMDEIKLDPPAEAAAEGDGDAVEEVPASGDGGSDED